MTDSTKTDQSEDGTKQPTVHQWHCLWELEDGSYKAHGGPYVPRKSKEIRDSMEAALERGEWSFHIPNDAVGVERVADSDLEDYDLRRGLI